MDILGLVGVGIGLLALGVSVWSVVAARRTGERQNNLQERLLALETAREQERLRERKSAQLRPAVYRSGHDYRLLILNDGPATARNVDVSLDGVSLGEHPLILGAQPEITRLAPGVNEYILAVTLGSPRVLDARLTWDDDWGAARTWESELML